MKASVTYSMKRNPLYFFCISVLLAAAVNVLGQGTAFTYQGRLNDGAAPANGTYDLRFTLYDAASGGSEVSGILTNTATAVSNGLFVVTLDFGAGAFTGPERWLEVSVRTNGGASFTTLSPRQPVTATPYAIFSASSGSVSNGLIQDPLFLGTTGNTPLELFAGGERALRLEATVAGAPNVIGGARVNQVEAGVSGATIAGGGAVGTGFAYSNRLAADFSTIGGGGGNYIQSGAYSSVIAGGGGNLVEYGGYGSLIAGGYNNIIRSNTSISSIGGGLGNAVGPDINLSMIGGGLYNTNAGALAGIASGYLNKIEPNSGLSFIGGGQENTIELNAGRSAIGGGWLNRIYDGADESVIAGGNAGKIFNGARESFIGGGFDNRIQTNAVGSSIGAGFGNSVGISSWVGTIPGGQNNSISNNTPWATIGGGADNKIMDNAERASIAGGSGNSIGNNSAGAAIAGGIQNVISNNAPQATIAGGYQNIAAFRYATVGGGYQNFASGNINLGNGDSATVAGGYQNTALGNNSTVAGGFANYARGENSAIGGGWLHTNLTSFGFIGGGDNHLIQRSATWSTIGGGRLNSILSNNFAVTIAGGEKNLVNTNAAYASIGGGILNSASGESSTIPGGRENIADGDYSFAAGRRAQAWHAGTFVWADSRDTNFTSSASNQFLIRASGGVGIGVTNPAAALHVAGTVKASAFEGSGALLTFTTTNNQPLEFKANGMRILRLEYAGDSETDSDTAPDGAPNVIGGAPNNVVQAGVVGATIAGGGATNLFGLLYPNTVGSDFAAIGGGAGHTIRSNSAASVIAGGFVNRILGTNVTDAASIGGGLGNAIHSGARHATIAGGTFNHIGVDAADATIAGGSDNYAGGESAVIGGGIRNTNFGEASIIAGGNGNLIGIGATHSVIAGGDGNRATGIGATVAGGISNTASGPYSFAAGHRATAGHAGSFVWADSQEGSFGSAADNQFLVRADFVGLNRTTPIGSEYFGVRTPVTNAYGGMYMETAGVGLPFYGYAMNGAGYAWTYLDGNDGNKWKLYNGGVWLTITTSGNVGIDHNSPSEKLHVNGNILASGTITPNSDRNAKTDITTADPQAILERVAALPIHEWRFKTEAEGVKHVGPMAQDFRAAFGLGAHETAIATVDADGVALAAIQALNQKLQDEVKRSREKDAKISALEARLARLEKLLPID